MVQTPVTDADLWHDAANELGEGPIWHPDRRSVLWFDIPNRRMFERSIEGGTSREHQFDVMASAAALVDERTVLVATEQDLRLVNLDTRDVLPLHPFVDAHAHIRSNDARVHPSGAFWISSMGKNAEADAGAIWWFHAGELRLLFDKITIGNAICFAPGGEAAYFADSAKFTIWRVATDPQTGLPVGDPVVFKRFGEGEGEPDGAVVDADGRIWTAAWGASAVHVWHPDGALVDRCALAVSQPTCPAFIGDDLSEMIVTSARQNLSAETLANEPQAGALHKLRRRVRGVPEPYVRLA